jgi:hypothetical protein
LDSHEIAPDCRRQSDGNFLKISFSSIKSPGSSRKLIKIIFFEITKSILHIFNFVHIELYNNVLLTCFKWHFYIKLPIGEPEKIKHQRKPTPDSGFNPKTPGILVVCITAPLNRFLMMVILILLSVIKPTAPTILERGFPICGLRPNHVCE